MINAELALNSHEESLDHAHVFEYLLKCGVFTAEQNVHSEMNEVSTAAVSMKMVELEIRANDNIVSLIRQVHAEKDGW